MAEGMIFASIGILVLCCFFSWVLYQIFRSLRDTNNTEQLYEVAHQTGIRKYFNKKGIDLDKEVMKQGYINRMKNKRSVRRRLEYEVYKDMFGDDKDVPE